MYLPLLWESSFCWKNPVALGYTRGHFSALVPMEMDMDDGIGAGANTDSSDGEQVAYLPLVDCEGKLLQVHFLTGSEVGMLAALYICAEICLFKIIVISCRVSSCLLPHILSSVEGKSRHFGKARQFASCNVMFKVSVVFL